MSELYLEIKRQAFHVIAGISVISSVLLELVDWKFFFLLFSGGVAISAISNKKKIPLISDMLEIFDRPDQKIPGKGALTFVAGSFMSLLFFEKNTALAAIAILTVGDAISRMGQFFGKIHFPWNKHKQVESSVLGGIGAFLAALYFVPALPAALASTAAMVVESFPITKRGHKIDDNYIMPLVAGVVIYLMGFI